MEKYYYLFVLMIVISIIIPSGSFELSWQFPSIELKNQNIQLEEPVILIPFDLIDDQVILDGEINEASGKLCFEINRAGIQIIKRSQNSWNAKEGALSITDISETKSESTYNIRIGDLTVSFTEAQPVDSEIIDTANLPLIGFVGRDLFSDREIVIDYNSKMITAFPIKETSIVKSILLIG